MNNKQTDPVSVIINLMDETPEETESRRKDNENRREDDSLRRKTISRSNRPRSRRQKAHAGLCLKESDFY